MIRKFIFQKLGDTLIKKIKTCKKEEVPYYYELGLKLEQIAIFFNVELE